MTEKVTIKDLTCKTCTRKKIQDQEGDILISWYCIALKMEMGRDPDMDDDDLTIMDRCGCAHHPLTLQVLAGPVIADLLKKIKEREYSDLEPKWKPSPPGDTIFDIMEERGISRMKLGYILGLREKSISDLLDGGFLIDNDMACKLSEVLGSSPDFWENRERNYRRELRECFNDDHDCIIRNQTICEILKHFNFNCPGGETTPICDMCGANKYCVEIRSGK